MSFGAMFYLICLIVVLAFIVLVLLRNAKRVLLIVFGIQISLFSILLMVANLNNSEHVYRNLAYVLFFIGFIISIVAACYNDKK